MQDAFGYVLFGVVGAGVLLALASLLIRKRTYEQIGAGGFFKDADAPKRAPDAAVDAAERDEEIRQLLRARNARHSEHGGEIVDVETELARLTQPAVDPALEAEVRDFVLRRNERLMAKGKEPLDVEEEVARRLRQM